MGTHVAILMKSLAVVIIVAGCTTSFAVAIIVVKMMQNAVMEYVVKRVKDV